MDECDDDTCEYAIEVSVVPKIELTKLLGRAQSGCVSSADIEALLGLYAQLEFGYGERLSLETTRMRFERYGKIPTIGFVLRKLDESLIGTFALIIISDAVQVP